MHNQKLGKKMKWPLTTIILVYTVIGRKAYGDTDDRNCL